MVVKFTVSFTLKNCEENEFGLNVSDFGFNYMKRFDIYEKY